MLPSVYLFLLILVLDVVSAHRSWQHVGKKQQRNTPLPNRRQIQGAQKLIKRDSPSPYLTNSTAKFVVNGSAIPDVDFDVGESYAGLLPISNKTNDENQLYFWFFPSNNSDASDELLIWLNGGPGCSSMEGLMEENGPWLWQHGVYKPVPNPYSWHNLTNVVWIDQPIGTGFTQGTPNITDEVELAAQFLGFWKNFVDTFKLHGRTMYIAGESYAGMYIPYIADAFLNKNDTKYYNLDSTMILDPLISSYTIQEEVTTLTFIDYFEGLFPFNATYKQYLKNMSESCGYDDFLAKYLTFPPPGPFPIETELPGIDADTLLPTDDCAIWESVIDNIMIINPCWDIYQVAVTCPLLWDVLGFPGTFDYLPEGAEIYFNRSEVQKAINAPETNWAECTPTDVFLNATDLSPWSAGPDGPLASVIERSNRTIIVNGGLDFIIMTNGTLLAIQNLTWNGKQGFQEEPSKPFFVPYHDEPSLATIAGSGIMGKTHTERGLTFVSVDLSGHMVPQYAPAAAYRLLEYLLGRIDSLDQIGSFTTDPFPQPGSFDYLWTGGNSSSSNSSSNATAAAFAAAAWALPRRGFGKKGY